MSGIATSIKKATPIIVVTWILSLVTTLAVVYVAPNIFPLKTTQISDSAITAEKIADSAVITTKLADGSVTSAKIENGTLTAENSFLIWKDGSTYYAKNGSTGAIQYFGTNATTVINNAISSLSFGGLVFLRDATYDIDGTISIVGKLNINIIGESWKTKINLNQNSSTDMMEITNSNYTAIKNLYFQGNRDSQTNGRGIVVYNSARVLIERCLFYEIKQTAIYVYGTLLMSSFQPWISKNYIEKIGTNNSDHGIWIGDYAPDAHVVDNDVGLITGSAIYVTSSGFLIVANTLWFSMYGLNVYLATSGEITGNIVDNNKFDGINIDSCSNLLVTGNTVKLNSYDPINSSNGIYLYNSNFTTVSGNRAGSVGDYKVETQRYGIKEYGVYSNYNLIVGNNVRGNQDSAEDIYSDGPNTVVSQNQGRYTAKNND